MFWDNFANATLDAYDDRVGWSGLVERAFSTLDENNRDSDHDLTVEAGASACSTLTRLDIETF